MAEGEPTHYDYDWLIVGSGFGGSTAALRLREKGYSVGVLECGRRYADHEFARSSWNLRRYFWAPRLGLRGIMRLSAFRDVLIATGCGVGGGSLGYANTLYAPAETSAFYTDPQWADLADWRGELAPHYDTATRMLGVTTYHPKSRADELLERFGAELGVADSFQPAHVGVFLGEPGVEVPDPYFAGAGPARTGCIRCGSCMVGCRYGAKNTLVKNYLYLAEQAGAQVHAEREVTDIVPLDGRDGASGYRLTTEHPGAWLRRRTRTFTARNVIVAAGALGTTRTLLRCRRNGSLTNLSPRLGELVRTNSEQILGVTAPNDDFDFSNTVAISSSIFPDAHTHVEPVTYGRAGGALSLLSTLLVGDGTRLTRPLRFLVQVARHPIRFLRVTFPRHWSRRTFLVLVMQSHDNSIALRPRRTLGRTMRLRTEQNADRPNPTYNELANRAAARIASYIDGIPQSSVLEALFNVPTTAHLLGGAPIGRDAQHGVVDAEQRIYGYRNLYVCDGSAIPANIGVNPALTIVAMTERVMARIPTAAASQGLPPDQVPAT